MSAGWGNTARAGLQPAHIQQAGREVGEPVQRLLGGSQQVSAVLGGKPDVAGAQAADRRLGRGERPAQVMADRREQRRPLPVGLGHPGGLPGQAAQQDRPPRPRLSRHVLVPRRQRIRGQCGQAFGRGRLVLHLLGRGRGRFRGDGSHPVLLAVLR